ncbi:unnamed protein product [Haemonchus placei]|uniref:RT_RNaseH domain-containing protein n=1 Tax=Haemonchus placei TaxID=6290 RepID=A0A0N4WNJ0_HAEPC|nr:unnamed protein product [Haemonchus placei]
MHTDHRPLTALFKRSNVPARVPRWALKVQKYNLEIIYLKGAANRVEDVLSRAVIPSDEQEKLGYTSIELIVAAALEELEWTTELRHDPIYAEIIASLDSRNLDRDIAMPKRNPETHPKAQSGRLCHGSRLFCVTRQLFCAKGGSSL